MQILPPVRFFPAPRVVLFISSFTTPGLRSFAQSMCADHQSSSVLSVVTDMNTISFRLVVDELDAVASSIALQMKVRPRFIEMDRMAVALMFLRSCYQNAGEGLAFLLYAWDDSLRLQVNLLHKTEPSLAVPLSHVLTKGNGNEDVFGLQEIRELRLRMKLGLQGIHRRYPKLAKHIQNHLQAVNTLRD